MVWPALTGTAQEIWPEPPQGVADVLVCGKVAAEKLPEEAIAESVAGHADVAVDGVHV